MNLRIANKIYKLYRKADDCHKYCKDCGGYCQLLGGCCWLCTLEHHRLYAYSKHQILQALLRVNKSIKIEIKRNKKLIKQLESEMERS